MLGATRREDLTKRKSAQPLGWSKECYDKIREKRHCYDAYSRDQIAGRKAEFKRLDSEVKIF